jgi:hypothetical protein
MASDVSESHRWRDAVRPTLRDPRFATGIVVAGAAIWLLVGAPTGRGASDLRGVYVASAVALFAVGLPQALTAWTEQAREAASQFRVRQQNLDEQRRVCLIALSAGSAGRETAEATATVANALAFHSGVLSPDKAGELLMQLYAGGSPQADLMRVVNELCEMRGDPAMYPKMGTYARPASST